MGLILDMGGFPMPGVPVLVNPRTGYPFGLYPERIDLTAGGNETDITINAPVYRGSLRISKNGALLNSSQYSRASDYDYTLASATTAGEVYTVEYLTTIPVATAAAFVPAITDPTFANNSALLHFDGANGSTTFTDVMGKTWTAGGSAALSTAHAKFGSACLAPAGGNITTAAHADFGFDNVDYTVEGWKILFSTAAAYSCLFDNRSGTDEGIAIYDRDSSGASFLKVFSSAGLLGTSSNGAPDLVNFYHWAVCRSGGTLFIGFNGIATNCGTDSRTYSSSVAPFLGSNYLGSQTQDGVSDEVRIKKGVALYTANYTPPPAPFPNS